MLSGTDIALAAAALVAGVTGSWSPCGFSMVHTLGPTGHTGGRSTTAAACATFGIGALAAGAATFGAFAAAGHVLGFSRAALASVAAAVAFAAALGEARGVRIVPQIRRQVPEHWRRIMPLPLAGGLYGFLLGLGFTTFVLTFAVWALAAISLLLGDVTAGFAIGLAFGLGRALPVLVLAPLSGGSLGTRLVELMAERPALLRTLRLADALALFLCASLLGAAAAGARPFVRASPATDPSAAGTALAWQQPGGPGILQLATGPAQLPGVAPALGGGYLAYRSGDTVVVQSVVTGAVVEQVPKPGVDKLAVSARWLVARVSLPTGGAQLVSHPIGQASTSRIDAAVSGATALSRPALDGDRLVYGIADRDGSRIVAFDLAHGTRRTVRRSRRTQYFNPSLLGTRLLYVSTGYCSQQLRIGGLTGSRDRVLLDMAPTARRDRGFEPGHTSQGSEPSRCPRGLRPPSKTILWSTALAPRFAYVTEAPEDGQASGTRILRVAR